MSKKVISSPFLFLFLSIIYPTVFLFTNNRELYNIKQLVVSFLIILIFSALLLLFLKIINDILISICSSIGYLNSKFNIILYGIYGCIGTGILWLLFLLPIYRIIENRFILIILFIASLIISYLFFKRIGFKYVNLIIYILIVLNLIYAGIMEVQYLFLNKIHVKNSYSSSSIVLKEKPNIYLFILESYHSIDVREKYYNIDNNWLISQLEIRGFQLFSNVYSNYGNTLSSVSSIFLMDHHYYKSRLRQIPTEMYFRKIIGGSADSIALEIMSKNGYQFDYSYAIDYLYSPSNMLNSNINIIYTAIRII